MNIEEFDLTYVDYKSVDKIEIPCDHPLHKGPNPTIGKQPARRNILKREGKEFICRNCCMKHYNPMNHVGEKRQTDELIAIVCPHPDHKGDRERQMKKSCFFGSMEDPQQICRSCSQLGREVSEEQRDKVSKKLKGRKLSEEHKNKILKYRKNNPQWAEQAKKNLIPGMGGIARKGIPLPQKWKDSISKGNKGKKRTLQHKLNISKGRKKMLKEVGGFTREHRENISKATVVQYENGFEPQLHHLKGWHSSPKAGDIYYRSSYEKKAYMILDVDDSVVTYSAETVRVEFEHPVKHITSTYLIDLEIMHTDGTIELVEIKPEKWLKDEVVVAKTAAAELRAKELGITFDVWTEEKLFKDEKDARKFAEWLKLV
jgi:hypothetical protein